jgi:hypothetical protein
MRKGLLPINHEMGIPYTKMVVPLYSNNPLQRDKIYQRNIRKFVSSIETRYSYISLYKNVNKGERLATLTVSISFIKFNIHYIYI